ncbi:hypothetical protein JCM16303_006704 [Sporobolomyces ruberrimus]
MPSPRLRRSTPPLADSPLFYPPSLSSLLSHSLPPPHPSSLSASRRFTSRSASLQQEIDSLDQEEEDQHARSQFSTSPGATTLGGIEHPHQPRQQQGGGGANLLPPPPPGVTTHEQPRTTNPTGETRMNESTEGAGGGVVVDLDAEIEDADASSDSDSDEDDDEEEEEENDDDGEEEDDQDGDENSENGSWTSENGLPLPLPGVGGGGGGGGGLQPRVAVAALGERQERSIDSIEEEVIME